jgi:glycosyltransferase involved in cell wall biosynthesis
MNNGIVKSNLFQGWPKDSLAQIVYSNLQPDFDVCERYWALTKTSVLLGALGIQRRAATPGPLDTTGTLYDPAAADAYESRPWIERLFTGLSSSVRTPIGEAIMRLPSVLSPALREWIDCFAPEAVFTLGGSLAILRLAVRIAEERGIPLIPYFTDDWISCMFQGGPLDRLLRKSLIHWFQRSLKLSSIRLTICDAMAREYERRYGGRFETFMNPVDPFEPTPETKWPMVRLSFIGALSPNRWQSVLSIGEALSRLRNRGIAGELLVYTFPQDIRNFGHRLTGCEAIRVAGTAKPDEVRRLQMEANVLVHVESFDESSRRYTRFSLSTKIPQYLMAGRCILAYGPAELASVRYVAESGAGMAISTEDLDELSLELERLVSSPALRKANAARARQTALARHDAVVERQRFRNLICAAVQSDVVGGGDKVASRDERNR